MTYLILFGAVVIGYIIASLLKTKEVKQMSIYLAFSGAFLLAVTIFELLPEVFANPSKTIGVYILAGIMLQICLEFFSKGAEHGHVHVRKNNTIFPWLLFVSLSIHAVLEGFPIHGNENLLYGIIIHKMPIAIILTSFFFASSLSNTKTIIFLTLFALMTPLGSYLSENVPFLTDYYTQISALVVGIFLHISTTILFESSEGHKFNITKLIAILAAIGIAYFI